MVLPPLVLLKVATCVALSKANPLQRESKPKDPGWLATLLIRLLQISARSEGNVAPFCPSYKHNLVGVTSSSCDATNDILVLAQVCQKMAHVGEHDQSQKPGQLCQTQAHLYRCILCVQSTNVAHLAPCWCDSGKTDAVHDCSTRFSIAVQKSLLTEQRHWYSMLWTVKPYSAGVHDTIHVHLAGAHCMCHCQLV
jgi:hypothetical protein